MRPKGQMPFTTIRCRRCKSRRVMGTACPDCGLEPRHGEVNSAVVRRRQAVGVVDAELKALSRGVSGVRADQPQEELLTFVDAFGTHLGALVDPAGRTEASAGMALTLRRLDDLVDVLGAASARRPGAEARAYLAVAQELLQLWPIYRDALTTLDMVRAKALGDIGQSVLDNAPRFLARARSVAEATEVLGGQKVEPSMARRVVRAMQILHPGVGWDGLVAEGARRARDAVGVDVADGASVDFLVLETVASAFFDPQAFSSKLQEAVQACAVPHRLREIAAMDGAVDGLEHLRRDLFETANQFTQVAEQETRSAAVVRRLAKTVGELYESAMPLLVWYRLLTGAAQGRDRYSKNLRDLNSTDLVRKIDHHLPLVSADMPAYLRNSAHHGSAFDFDEASASVSIRLASHNERMDLADYLDRVLALLESLHAALWALGAALERSGVDVPLRVDDAQYMGLYMHDFAAWWLEQHFGVDKVMSEIEDGTWTIEADLPSTEAVKTALALAQNAAPNVERVTVLTPGIPRHPVEFDLDDYDRYAEQAEQGAAAVCIAMLEFRHRATRTGVCLLTEADVEFAVLALANLLINSHPEMVTPLRRARQLARTHGFDDLARLAASAIATLRTGDTDGLLREIGPRVATATAPVLPTGPVATVHLSARSRTMQCAKEPGFA